MRIVTGFAALVLLALALPAIAACGDAVAEAVVGPDPGAGDGSTGKTDATSGDAGHPTDAAQVADAGTKMDAAESSPPFSCTAGTMEKEPNDTLAQANPIVVGSGVCGTLSSTSDVDYFTFTLTSEAETIISFTASGNSELVLMKPIDTVTTIGSTPGQADIDDNPDPAGDYVLEVRHAKAPQTYVITITQ